MSIITWQQQAADVRRKVGFPKREVLDDGIIYAVLLEVYDELVTELNLSGVSWYAPRFTVTTNADEDEYDVLGQAGDFGRALFVMTANDSNLNHHARVIQVVDEPQLIKYFEGGVRGAEGLNHSANAVSFAYREGTLMMRFAPIPRETAQYTVVYEPDVVRPQAIQENAFRLAQFSGYATDRASQKVLPYAGLDAEMLAAISATLATEVARGDLRFRRFKANDRQTNVFKSVPFGRNRWGRRRAM